MVLRRRRVAEDRRPAALAGSDPEREATAAELTSTHGDAARAWDLLTNLSLFLSGLKNTAEPLGPEGCWERIWARILQP